MEFRSTCGQYLAGAGAYRPNPCGVYPEPLAPGFGHEAGPTFRRLQRLHFPGRATRGLHESAHVLSGKSNLRSGFDPVYRDPCSCRFCVFAQVLAHSELRGSFDHLLGHGRVCWIFCLVRLIVRSWSMQFWLYL